MKLLVTSIAFVLLFSASSQAVEPKLVPVVNQTLQDQNLNQGSEIVLERVYSGCRGCGDYQLTLTREKGDDLATLE